MIKLLPLAVALALAGCSLAPPHERPLAPVPADWSEKIGSGNTAAVAVPADWRNYFSEPQLQALIAAALEHNRDLRIAVARVDEARALAGVARADRLPGIDATLQQQAARLPADLSSSGQEMITRRYDGNLGVTAFELDVWGRLKNLGDAAQAGFLATDYARQTVRLGLIADVATTWYGLVDLDLRLALSRATEQGRAENLQLVRHRRDAGLAGDLDALAADAAYQTARAETASLARQRVLMANALRLLTGSEPAVSPQPTFGELPELAVGLPADVLLQRPDVLAAEQKLVAANANIGAARAAFFPKIALTVLAGAASPALAGLFGGGSGAWSFVPVLKYPLFDGGRTDANVDVAEARKVVAVAEYERTVQQAFREVADLLAARTHYAEQLRALEAAELAQRERLQRVEARHRLGVSSYLELLDAQRDQFAARQQVVSVRRALATTAASLFKALSGAGGTG